jgi:hypothetical protein
MIRSRPKAARRHWRREGWRHLAIVATVGALIGLSVPLWHDLGDGHAPAPDAKSPALEVGASDDDIYTGSILYMPDDGKTCRQHLFDNNSGRLFDNGSVDCARAAYRPASLPPKNWSVARTHVISYGFRHR